MRHVLGTADRRHVRLVMPDGFVDNFHFGLADDGDFRFVSFLEFIE